MKKYTNAALVYMILGLCSGVFYREFTKLSGFEGRTALSYMHVHYVALGTLFFLLLLLMEKNFAFANKRTNKILVTYHVGFNITQAFFLVRGIAQVLKMELNTMTDAAISGFAGIGHILMGVTLVLLMNQIRNKIKEN